MTPQLRTGPKLTSTHSSLAKRHAQNQPLNCLSEIHAYRLLDQHLNGVVVIDERVVTVAFIYNYTFKSTNLL